MAHQLIEFRDEMANFQFGFQIHAIVVLSLQAILCLLPVLTHHDDRRPQSREAGQNKIEQNIGVGAERVSEQGGGVENNPEQQKNTVAETLVYRDISC